jgi:hypothetical protein
MNLSMDAWRRASFFASCPFLGLRLAREPTTTNVLDFNGHLRENRSDNSIDLSYLLLECRFKGRAISH